MTTRMIPGVLSELARAGEEGLSPSPDPVFRREIDLCRAWGFRIRADSGRVRLEYDREQLVPRWIAEETPALAWPRLDVRGFLSCGSTNTEAYALAEQGAASGTLVFAETQTGGRGRHGRAWHSPAGAGLYCTLVLRPRQPAECWPLLTLAASVALVDALRELPAHGVIPRPLETDLKWPNDVLVSGKKCAGILLEAVCGGAGQGAVIVGSGINVHAGSVPGDLRETAACLDEASGARIPRRLLLVSYLRRLEICYLLFEEGKHRELLECWKERSSMWDGAEIVMGDGASRREGVTCGLTAIGALRVRRAGGRTETLMAEDVRVLRPKRAK